MPSWGCDKHGVNLKIKEALDANLIRDQLGAIWDEEAGIKREFIRKNGLKKRSG